MTLWFLRGLRRGIVTTRYPARPEPSAAYLPTPPAFRPDVLTAGTARRLAVICPSHALRFDAGTGAAGTGTLFFDVGACTCCGRCAAEAPGAVTVSGEWELATTGRSALIKTIPLRGEAP
ncbi:MAG TPA: hypothetical protein VGG75_09500 [Trebonia sp.]|jgi:formate hydrogenlyase subunit 6/NADH:ubiquinone oxidoreductase subunit I